MKQHKVLAQSQLWICLVCLKLVCLVKGTITIPFQKVHLDKEAKIKNDYVLIDFFC